ncbi:hypothetical protein MO973_10345 [Paenibacillus sp. TRM 82003]|nr:hypothetical protein [Paenibacillus sp. TRM 82003]
MDAMVDPRKVEELAQQFLKLKRTIEDRETGIHRQMSGIVAATRSQYHESYVRTAAAEAEGTLGEIRRLSASISSRLQARSSTLVQAANTFRRDEEAAKSMASRTDPFQEFLEKDGASDRYEWYDGTVGTTQDAGQALRRAMYTGALAFLGFRFEALNGKFAFQLLDDVKLGKLKLPIGSLIQRVEASRVNGLARFYVNKLSIFYKDKSLAELIYRRFTRFFPSDLTTISNTTKEIGKALRASGSLSDGAAIVKANAGQLLRNAGKIAKANAITAVAITAGTETIGAGIRIVENYAKYGHDIEKLKEENAKEVGRAAYNTAVISTTTIGGAVIGGTVGSLLGPAGTVIGAAAGGFVGSVVGDLICKKTPEWVEDASLYAKDAIYAGTEFVADAVRGTKDTFDAVKEHTGKLIDNARGFASNVTGAIGKLAFF